MLPAPPTLGFEPDEVPSGVRRRRAEANYHEELARWFDRASRPLEAVGTSDATPASPRIPFLIF